MAANHPHDIVEEHEVPLAELWRPSFMPLPTTDPGAETFKAGWEEGWEDRGKLDDLTGSEDLPDDPIHPEG